MITIIQGRMRLVIIYIHLFFLSGIATTFHAQITFHQDIFNGGVTVGGFSTGEGFGSGNITFYVEPQSTIRKAYLFTYSLGFPPPSSISINNVPFLFDSSNEVTSVTHVSEYVNPVKIHYKDLTDFIDPIITSIDITIETQFGLPINTGWWTALLYIEYDNPKLPLVSTALYLNDKNLTGYENYNMENLNPINTDYPIALGVFIDRACDIVHDGTIVTLNDTIPLGIIGSSDSSSLAWTCAGAKGNFYFQNNTLYGLEDDTADSLMHETDALADISSYLTFGSNSYSLNLLHTSFPLPHPAYANVNLLFSNAYVSTCDPFHASISENITTCAGVATPLHATGGVATSSTSGYQWHPQIDLSCYDCASPVFVGDTSRFYTCRIWNTDSCSKVLPVKVNVLQLPQAAAFTTTPTQCYGNTGEVTATFAGNSLSYAMDGSAPQTSRNFTGLAAGEHVLTTIDSHGCKTDTMVFIDEVNTTVAHFSASPQSGDVPLEVTLTNQSTNATHYIWHIAGDTLHTTSTAPFTHTYTTDGSFDIALIAYHTHAHCSDTTAMHVVAKYPFTIIAPTLYSGIMTGAPYSIYTSGVNNLEYKLFSADGRLIQIIKATPTAGHLPLWNSTHLAAGMYVYHIRATADNGAVQEFTGKVVVL
jgi:hypothetical protein